MWARKVTNLRCDSEGKFLSNDYTNHYTNPRTLTTLTPTLTETHDAFENFCALVFSDFIRNYFGVLTLTSSHFDYRSKGKNINCIVCTMQYLLANGANDNCMLWLVYINEVWEYKCEHATFLAVALLWYFWMTTLTLNTNPKQPSTCLTYPNDAKTRIS